MAEQEGETTTNRTRVSRTKTYPLNSRRLTASVVGRIAKALGLAISASLEDTRQVVGGKIEEMGRQPRNVQVELSETEGGVVISLRDDDGAFLESQPENPENEDEDSARAGEEDGGAREESRSHEEGGSHSASPGGAHEAALEAEVDRLTEENTGLHLEVSGLRERVEDEKRKYKQLWRDSCEQLADYDAIIAGKESEITRLKARVAELEARGYTPEPRVLPRRLPEHPTPARPPPASAVSSPTGTHSSARVTLRHGKAPPIDSFDGESSDTRFDDWFPMLQRAATWYGWSEEETLLQLAGHLRRRAFQEWNLLDSSDKMTVRAASTALRNRLDPGSRSMAAQDFRHATQRESETVSDFILRLERIFQSAYGRDGLSNETRDTLLHGQLQEGLLYELMSAPAVSGALKYQELCLTARNEEKRLKELKKRRQFSGRSTPEKPRVQSQERRNNRRSDSSSTVSTSGASSTPSTNTTTPQTPFSPSIQSGRCFRCGKTGHFSRNCRALRQESSGRQNSQTERTPNSSAGTNQVQVSPATGGDEDRLSGYAVLDLLFSSDSEDNEIRQIRISDHGSKPCHAKVDVQGVPARGVIDSGSDITIIGGDLFKRVAAVARLKKKYLKKPDKVPRTYDQRPFTLDGLMDLDISFCGTTMKTPVYVKMDAPESLLLSKGVCRQLTYHPSILTRQKNHCNSQPCPSESGQVVQGHQAAGQEVKMEWSNHNLDNAVRHKTVSERRSVEPDDTRESIQGNCRKTEMRTIVPGVNKDDEMIIMSSNSTNKMGRQKTTPSSEQLQEDEIPKKIPSQINSAVTTSSVPMLEEKKQTKALSQIDNTIAPGAVQKQEDKQRKKAPGIADDTVLPGFVLSDMMDKIDPDKQCREAACQTDHTVTQLDVLRLDREEASGVGRSPDEVTLRPTKPQQSCISQPLTATNEYAMGGNRKEDNTSVPDRQSSYHPRKVDEDASLAAVRYETEDTSEVIGSCQMKGGDHRLLYPLSVFAFYSQ